MSQSGSRDRKHGRARFADGVTGFGSRLLGRLRALFARKRLDADLDDELRLHIELETEKNVRAGMSPAEARRRALVAFGGVDRYREAARDARGVRGLEDVGRDLRYAVRGLLRRPGFTVAAVLTLSLGIGANTAVFSAVNSLILHPLPFKGGNRIVYAWVTYPKSGVMLTPPQAVEDAWLARSHSFDGAARYSSAKLHLTTGDDSTAVEVKYIDASYFGFLGLHPVLGRAFTKAETLPGGSEVAILAYGEWKSRYGGAANVLGRQLRLGGQSRTVVGVAPPTAADLGYQTDARYFLPLRLDRVPTVGLAARLQPGVTTQQAEHELTAILAQVKDRPSYMDGWRATLLRPQDLLGGSLRTTLFVLLGAVGLVLLIACANVGSLLLARASTRAREMAVRTSLGASRGRLVRQLLTESSLLALAGGALGALLAEWSLRLMARIRPISLSDLDAVAIDHRALLFTAGVVVLATILFGLYPALRASRVAPAGELKAGTAGEDARRVRMRMPVTALEVALSVLLLVGAGLLVRTLLSLEHEDPGYRPAGVAMALLQFPEHGYTEAAARKDFLERMEARTRRIPGVTGAMVTIAVPLQYGFMTGRWASEGQDPEHGVSGLKIAYVPPNYFSLLGIPILKGHAFGADASNGEPVAIVSRGLARAMAPDGGNVLGMRARNGDKNDWRTVVGVADDMAATSMRGGPDNRYQVYYPLEPGQFSWRSPRWLVARTTGDAEALTASLRAIVQAADPDVRVVQAETAEHMIHASLSSPRFYATTLTGFAFLALLLAAVGLFGVLSYGVQRRRHEIAVRVALGASIGDVRMDVVRQALVPVVIGLAVGIALSAVATRVLASLLFGIGRMDPTTMGAVGVVVLVTALLASYLPARRATRVDPMATLRAE